MPKSPKQVAADRTIYPFRTMKVGEEFFVPHAKPAFRHYVYHRAAVMKRKFTVRQETRRGVTGIVVERIPA